MVEAGTPAARSGDSSAAASPDSQQRSPRLQHAGSTPAIARLSAAVEQAQRRRDELKLELQLRRLTADIQYMEEDPGNDPDEPATRGRRRSDESDERRPERQPKELREYWGNSVREHQEWTRAAENAFAMAPKKFKPMGVRIAWAAQSLRGSAQSTWSNACQGDDLYEYTWDDFKTLLLDAIEDKANRELDAAQRYHDAHQRVGQKVLQFHQQLMSLERQLDEGYTEGQLRTHLWVKLRPEIRSRILMYQDIPSTRDAIVALATRIENNDLTIKKRASSRSPERRPARAKSQRRDGQESARDTRRDDRGFRRSDLRPTPTFSTPAYITCWNCNRKGHYATDCKAPRKEGASAANATQPGKGWRTQDTPNPRS